MAKYGAVAAGILTATAIAGFAGGVIVSDYFSKPGIPYVVDANKDNKPDIVLVMKTGELYVSLQNKDGEYEKFREPSELELSVIQYQLGDQIKKK